MGGAHSRRRAAPGRPRLGHARAAGDRGVPPGPRAGPAHPAVPHPADGDGPYRGHRRGPAGRGRRLHRQALRPGRAARARPGRRPRRRPPAWPRRPGESPRGGARPGESPPGAPADLPGARRSGTTRTTGSRSRSTSPSAPTRGSATGSARSAGRRSGRRPASATEGAQGRAAGREGPLAVTAGEAARRPSEGSRTRRGGPPTRAASGG